MDAEPRVDGPPGGETAESFLEALLVEDAELDWDPKSGKAHVTRRQPKTELDSAPGSA
ncbi:MAG TPA: hypothetical protein VFR33_03435 [Candidatus Dormibacteraeota bacterium]|nr:hypothetical protein [Candidatus Dormibacteraeota bacterium]